MNKNVQQGFEGLVQDINKSNYSNKFYFNARNIRVIATDTQSTGAVTNEKGNSLILTVPTPIIDGVNKKILYNNKKLIYTTNEINDIYLISGTTYRTSGDQLIIGHTFSRDSLILLTTDNNGFDCVWKVNDITYDITLLYMRDLQFNITNPIQCINNFENDIIDKIYWVDGKNQMRFLNLEHSILNGDLEELIDVSSNILNIVGDYTFTQPKIIDILSGGIHTAGMIQYAYNLYKLNGSQTKISPLSELISLDNNIEGGGDINEIVKTLPVINIDVLDNDYTNIRLYAIKYTSFNQIPSVSLILDKNIVGLTEVTYYDDGNIIETVSLEEFLFLGSDIIIPKHINTKKNIMFLANYKEKNLEINLDTRAYSFPMNALTTEIYNSLIDDGSGNPISNEPSITVYNTYTVPEKFSSINKNYMINKYQYNSSILGGEGMYLKYKIVRSEVGINGFTNEDINGRFFKDNELYRLGIKFYNKYGADALPKWIADFIVATDDGINLNDKFASLEITLKAEFYIWLNDQSNFLDDNGNYDEFLKPVGYKLIIGERTLLDRSIICQGLINGMISNNKNGNVNTAPFSPEAIDFANAGDKLPSLMRRYDNYLCPQYRMSTYDRVDSQDPTIHPNLKPNPISPFTYGAGTEVFNTSNADDRLSETFQFNQLMQMYSPEATFDLIQNMSNVQLNVIGGAKNDNNYFWGQLRKIETKQVISETKVIGAISPYDVKAVGVNLQETIGNWMDLVDKGFFEVAHGDDNMEFVQTYRSYMGTFNPSIITTYDTYSTPLLVEKGQGRTIYANNSELVFYNSLEQLTADGGRYLYSVNTFGSKNITFALGDSSLATEDRTKLEDIHASLGMDDDIAVIGEFKIPNILIYVGNLYKGNSYESKKRTNYIEIGEYQEINTNIYYCKHPGDTFVQKFQFTKLVKTETEVYSKNSQQHTEIVSVRLETSIDLQNRNDLSLTPWDNRFQPQYNEYQKYNTVYSQQSNLIKTRDVDYKFKKTNNFDTTIISTKIKVPGEIIDSWTDIQVNNILHLKGEYGPINSLYSFKDNIFSFQDTGIAFISILPRVQTQASDGLSLELGLGSVLQDYNYITTESGSINKWAIASSSSAIYYYDALNRSFNSFRGQIEGQSDTKGMHTYFYNNSSLQELKIDNPLIKQGVVVSFDYINNDIFITLHQNDQSFTLSYNENKQNFISFYDYIPSMYMSKGDNFITTSPDISQIWKQYAGDYNSFYGEIFPSYITFNVNPEPNLDCVFDNINFKSDVTLNNVDQPEITLNKIQAYNDYQDSGLVPIVVGRNENARRKFRDWNVLIPRQNRNRIRAPYIKLKLQFQNENNYKLIFYSPSIYYTT
jgi:hypothetical protein